MRILAQLALPLVAVIGVLAFTIVGYLLKSNWDNEKAVRGKLKAYILLENKVVWKGLCDYTDTKVRAPWSKGWTSNKEGERVQQFMVMGKDIWYDKWPESGWFRQTIPCAFFHEREIRAIFPPAPCNCGHEECQGTRVQEVTPSQWGLIEDEHVTEATLKATMWVKEMFDKMGDLLTKLPPAWLMWAGFGACLLGIVILGILLYRMGGDIGWIKGYIRPAS